MSPKTPEARPPFLVVGLPDAGALPAQLATQLRCDRSDLALHRFPDGECLVRLDADVQGRCVVFAGSLDHPDGKTLPLLFAADAARELGAARVGLVAPYLAYMRQDHRFHAGEAVTSRSYARLLSGALEFLVTVDPHLHRWHSLGDIYPIPTRAVAAAPAIAQWLRREVAAPLLVGPDEESGQWVAEVARLCGAPWTVMAKQRHGDRDVAVKMTGGTSWPGRTPVLLDDIGSSGQTLVAALQVLREAGFSQPVCIVVHALFGREAQQAMLDAGAARVVSCDTVAHPTNAIAVAPLLAPALLEIARV
ncbi:ribose-phosphate pyrophosphokinase [Ramlibacter sp. RBP-2]|uniref:Ribose-phosphate pyrophosphokinase n=1 Tax=Ramlibacter lithotrophicus TaxID=2606681 RepID=A0A7X6DEJ4_9BURK|nr:ribose-phosphate pyrophosphokinase [Ramlibacter lithotrophicus]NKE65719.1 ribose-phosphate pyrophosphokinase [Ramlibacter lithotrophicus]